MKSACGEKVYRFRSNLIVAVDSTKGPNIRNTPCTVLYLSVSFDKNAPLPFQGPIKNSCGYGSEFSWCFHRQTNGYRFLFGWFFEYCATKYRHIFLPAIFGCFCCNKRHIWTFYFTLSIKYFRFNDILYSRLYIMMHNVKCNTFLLHAAYNTAILLNHSL